MAIKGIAVLATLGTLIAAASAHAAELAIAQKMADGCEAKATQEGWKMNIAVVDAGGNLVSHVRMDGAWIGSIDVAIKRPSRRAHSTSRRRSSPRTASQASSSSGFTDRTAAAS